MAAEETTSNVIQWQYSGQLTVRGRARTAKDRGVTHLVLDDFAPLPEVAETRVLGVGYERVPFRRVLDIRDDQGAALVVSISRSVITSTDDAIVVKRNSSSS